MQEFASISVSSYEAAALADRLTEQSSEGWSVVAIVPTGSTITAYLSRPADGADADSADETAVEAAEATAAADTLVDETADDIAAAAAVVAPEPEPAPEPEATPEPEPEPEPTTAEPEPAAEAPAATTAVAAGWYADPSARFELRYWDGTQWTEHVSRGGQQYTDPPVA